MKYYNLQNTIKALKIGNASVEQLKKRFGIEPKVRDGRTVAYSSSQIGLMKTMLRRTMRELPPQEIPRAQGFTIQDRVMLRDIHRALCSTRPAEAINASETPNAG